MAINDAQDDNSDQAQDMSVQQDYAEVTRLRPTVGDEMRMHREQAGHTIADLAEALRIQKRYLEAIEEGRIEDLPGTVYALGFLRTYAEYYGLDGDAYVTRFKEETEGQRRDQQYMLPEPIEEARVPTAAIVLVGVVLAIGAIVAWYSFHPQEPELGGAVPEPPTHLATAVENAPAEPASAATSASPASPETTGAEAQGDTPVDTASTEAETPPAESAVSAETSAALQPAAEQSPPATAEQSPPPEPVVVEAAPAAPEAAAEEAAPAAPETVAVLPADVAAPETPAAVEDTGPHIPQIYGAPASARIVITAAEDSWIEVTDEEGSRLLSRTLRAGDTYYVPDRSGLTLVTGNAGGLSIAVDGTAAPAIGDVGIVRKNVKLDPELLKQGRAWP